MLVPENVKRWASKRLSPRVRTILAFATWTVGVLVLVQYGAFKDPWLIGGLVLALGAIPFLLYQARSAPAQPLFPKRIHLIAWSGFNETQVVGPYEAVSDARLNVLEYVRGIEKVTHLRNEGSLFDVLISDVEFLARHHIGFTLHSLTSPEYRPLWDKVIPSLAYAVKQEGGGLGIPVRFGVNDIVLNVHAAPPSIRDKTERNDAELSYTLSFDRHSSTG